MRKLLSVLSSTLQGGLRGGLLLLALLATTSLWAEDFSVGGIYYKYLDGNNVKVTYRGSGYNSYSNEYSGAVTIPETVTYNGTTYSVTSIGGYAFLDCSSLTSITIPNSVTSIGEYAFYGCSLTSITIPNSVTSIGYAAFFICSSLTSITIPNSVTSIGEGAFNGCSELKSMVVESGNTVYDSRGNCNAIIETATNTLIAGCQNTIIPNSVTSIGNNAFYRCSSLASITIPNSVTSIGSYAFEDCTSLTSITIPNSVTYIDDYAFENCSSLTSIIWNAKNCAYYTSPLYAPFYDIRSQITSFVFGDNVEHVPAYLCYGMSKLTSITIPNSVTSIEGHAFEGCSSLTSVTIGNSVTSIGYYAFKNCSSLTSITIPNSVTSIGGNAFEDCSSLTSIIWNAKNCADFLDFSYAPFDDICSQITSFIFGDNVEHVPAYLCYGMSKLTSITIPNSVTSIGWYAFYGCSSLTSITIPNSVTSIGREAFEGCSSLTSVTCEATIPPTLGSYAFFQVSKSIPVYVPCGSEDAYKVADGWKDFTNIQEPQAEYSIQVSTSNSQMGSAIVNYNNCTGNQITATANYGYHFVQWSDGNTDNPRSLVLTQDTVLTAEFAQIFSGQCGDNLYWSYQNNTLTVSGFGEMYNERPWGLFVNEIKTVVLPNGITHIGDDAFSDCTGLSEITIPYTVTSIGDYAFAGCRKLYDIYCFAMEPPTAQQSSFANYNAFLHVPCENERVYLLDVVFGEFKYIECIDTENVPTDDVVVTPGTNDVTITWPTEGNADTYTIVIKKGDEVFCTLTFNANGQLLNIAFAPGRNGNHPAQYAEQAANGYRFTVTGLEAGTHYAYNIDVRDAANKTITSHTGDFTTKSNVSTAVDDITTNANIQKIMRNGQLIILRDGKTYNAMGQEL